MMAEDPSMIALATPTRFLIENGEWNLTPSLTSSIQNEINPFDDCTYQQRALTQKELEAPTVKWPTVPSPIMNNIVYHSPEATLIKSPPTPPMSLSQSPSSSTASFSMTDLLVDNPAPSTEEPVTAARRSSRIQTKPQNFFNEYVDQPAEKTSKTSSGRKRRIVFEGDDAEDRRKKFLERNRVAAYKCRQKKKNWMQELEQKAEIQNSQNEQLRSLVAQLKEESMYLRNLLLTHGNCDCDSVQAYLRKQSAEITNSSSPLTAPGLSTMSSRRDSLTSASTFPSMPSYPGSFNSALPTFHQQSTGLTPFLTTVINKPNHEPSDYFSQSHSNEA